MNGQTQGLFFKIINHCKENLEVWSWNKFGDITRKIQKVRSKLEHLKTGAGVGHVVSEIKMVEEELDDLLKMEEIRWR